MHTTYRRPAITEFSRCRQRCRGYGPRRPKWADMRGSMKRKDERGVALILTLILLLIVSVMAVSLMFISQTETWASMNYKLMSQSRDGAEAGINAAANYIINTYSPPA